MTKAPAVAVDTWPPRSMVNSLAMLGLWKHQLVQVPKRPACRYAPVGARCGRGGSSQMQKSTTHALATVLQASSESDALVILGRILDSLPIGFHVSDCGSAFHVLYA